MACRHTVEEGELSAAMVLPIGVEQARTVRDAVLRAGLPPGGSVYPGDDAADTLHLGAWSEGCLIGVATVCREPLPADSRPDAWRLRGMATVPAARGRGMGRQLAQECVAYAREKGAAVVWCSARLEVASFYADLGFVAYGEPFRLPEFSDRVYVLMRLEL